MLSGEEEEGFKDEDEEDEGEEEAAMPVEGEPEDGGEGGAQTEPISIQALDIFLQRVVGEEEQ